MCPISTNIMLFSKPPYSVLRKLGPSCFPFPSTCPFVLCGSCYDFYHKHSNNSITPLVLPPLPPTTLLFIGSILKFVAVLPFPVCKCNAADGDNSNSQLHKSMLRGKRVVRNHGCNGSCMSCCGKGCGCLNYWSRRSTALLLVGLLIC